MAEEKRYQSPEELGNAVGQKIEELFGGLFDAPQPPKAPAKAETKPPQQAKTAPASSRPPAAPERPAAAQRPAPTAPERPSAAHRAPAAPQRPAEPQPPAPPAAAAKEPAKKGSPFEELLDRLEAQILNLEWDTKVETIRELAQAFKDAERYFPKEGPGRTIVTINQRVLKRFSTPGMSPHPMMARLLQDSVAGLRQLLASRGKTPPDKALMQSIVSTYNLIAGAAAAQQAAAEKAGGEKDFSALVNDMGGVVTSLDELSRHLGKITAFLRKGGQAPQEEIARKLSTVATMLSERVAKLTALHQDMSSVSPAQAGGERPAAVAPKGGPDGVLMMEWETTPLAIPSSCIVALFPLTKAQAEQFLDKASITLSGRAVNRIPLKSHAAADQRSGVVPTWLIHLSIADKDYFLLADRALGYRRPPKGVDLARESKMKIGNSAYTVLNELALQ